MSMAASRGLSQKSGRLLFDITQQSDMAAVLKAIEARSDPK